MVRPVGEEYTSELLTYLADSLMTDFIGKVLSLPNSKRAKVYDSLASKYAIELKLSTTPRKVEFNGGSIDVYESALSLIPKLKKELLKRLTPEDFNKPDITSLKVIINTFNHRLNQQFKTDIEIKNKDYRERLKNRKSETAQIDVDFTPWLDKVEALFKQLELYLNGEEGINKPDWRDISIAIALCTGRRQSEIHYSGKFSLIADYELSFSGQLKGKKRTVEGKALSEVEFKVPTICPASYILMGVQFLEMESKRTDREDGVEVVNKRWGKPLSQRIKSDWMIISDDDFKRADPDDKNGMTYHKTRGSYLVLSIANLQTGKTMNALQLARYVEQILGDKDMSALEPYERFCLVEGSRTRI